MSSTRKDNLVDCLKNVINDSELKADDRLGRVKQLIQAIQSVNQLRAQEEAVLSALTQEYPTLMQSFQITIPFDDLIDLGVKNNSLNIAHYLLETYQSESDIDLALQASACYGCTETARFLLLDEEKRFKISQFGLTAALHCAASKGQNEMVKVLIDAGAGIKLDFPKNWHETALHGAVVNRHMNVVRTLLKARKKIGLETAHLTSALKVAQKDDMKMLQLLILEGAEIQTNYWREEFWKVQPKDFFYTHTGDRHTVFTYRSSCASGFESDFSRLAVLLDSGLKWEHYLCYSIPDSRLGNASDSELFIYELASKARAVAYHEWEGVSHEKINALANKGYSLAAHYLGEIKEKEKNVVSAANYYIQALKLDNLRAPYSITTLLEKLYKLKIEKTESKSSSSELNKAEQEACQLLVAAIYRCIINQNYDVYLTAQQWIFLAKHAIERGVKDKCFENEMKVNHFAKQAVDHAENRAASSEEIKSIKQVSALVWSHFGKLKETKELHQQREIATTSITSLISAYCADARVNAKLFQFFESSPVVVNEEKDDAVIDERFALLRTQFDLCTKKCSGKVIDKVNAVFRNLEEAKSVDADDKIKIALGCIISEYQNENKGSIFSSTLAVALNQVKRQFFAELKKAGSSQHEKIYSEQVVLGCYKQYVSDAPSSKNQGMQMLSSNS